MPDLEQGEDVDVQGSSRNQQEQLKGFVYKHLRGISDRCRTFHKDYKKYFTIARFTFSNLIWPFKDLISDIIMATSLFQYVAKYCFATYFAITDFIFAETKITFGVVRS